MKPARLLAALFLVALGACPRPTEPRDNLLLITIDTLRRDHLGCYGHPRATTPNLDRLAAEGVVFDAASTPRAKTTPALASLFTGCYPHEHGVRELLQPLEPSRRVLAECFREAGWRTAAIVGNFVLEARHSGFARGFERYVERLPSAQGVPPDDVPQRTARSLTLAAGVALALDPAPALDEDRKPFDPSGALVDPARPWFLWLHYMDPHGAYEPPEEDRVFHGEPRWIAPETEAQIPASASPRHRRRVSAYNVPLAARRADGAFDAQAVIDLYDGEIRAVDRELGGLLERLRARGDLARTWIVVTADHGESLGEHDYWFEHGFYACEATCAIPLIVRPPDRVRARLAESAAANRRAGALSLADLGPTLAEWLGLPTRPEGTSVVRGVSRAALLEHDDRAPRATFSEKIEGADRLGTVQLKAVRLGGWKLIQRLARRPDPDEAARARIDRIGEELYDLGADPLEARDLLAEGAVGSEVPLERLEALRTELLRFAACDEPFEELEARLELRRRALEAHDAEALRRLKSLGY